MHPAACAGRGWPPGPQVMAHCQRLTMALVRQQHWPVSTVHILPLWSASTTHTALLTGHTSWVGAGSSHVPTAGTRGAGEEPLVPLSPRFL